MKKGQKELSVLVERVRERTPLIHYELCYRK